MNKLLTDEEATYNRQPYPERSKRDMGKRVGPGEDGRADRLEEKLNTKLTRTITRI